MSRRGLPRAVYRVPGATRSFLAALAVLGIHRLLLAAQGPPPAPQMAQAEPSVTRQDDARELTPGASFEEELAGGQSRTYWILLESGQFLQVVVDQRGIDVAVTVLGPADQPILEVDSPNGAQVPERVSLIAEAAGDYRLRVSASAQAAPLGRYGVTVKELRDATPQDESRVAAERTFAEAERLRAQGTAASQRAALGRYTEALELWRAAADRRGEAETLGTIGYLEWSLDELSQALEHHRQALALWRTLGDGREEATQLSNIGAVYSSMGELQAALEHYRQALPLRGAAGDREGEAITLHNIGHVHDERGEFPEALAHYEQAIALLRAVGDRRGEGVTLNNIGVVYASLGEHEKALEHHRRALALRRAVGNRRGEAVTLTNIGYVYRSMGEPQRALEYYNQALPLDREVGNRMEEARTLTLIGSVHTSLGENQKASESLELALAIAQELGAGLQEGYTLAALARVRLQRGDPRGALDAGQQALARAEQTGALQLDWHARRWIARSLRASGQADEAVAQLHAATQSINSLRGRLLTDAGKIGVLDRWQEVFQDLVGLLREQARAPEALEVAEAARSRAFSDLLAGRQIVLTSAGDAAMRSIREAEARLRAQFRTAPLAESARLELARERASTESDLGQRLRSLASEQPELASLVAAEPVSASEIASTAQRLRATFVEYLVAEERLFIWVVSPSGEVQSATVEVGRDRLRQSVRELHEQLNSADLAALRDPRPVRERLAELYRWTLAPVARLLPSDPEALLYLIPHDALFLVPFAALVDERGRYVLDTHTCLSAPALGVLRYTAEKKQRVVSAEAPRLLAIADPLVPEGSGVAGLPWARGEVERIGRRFPPERRTLLLAERASEANVKRLGPGQTLLHFAVHGLVRDDRPWDSALILAKGDGEDGWLKAGEVFGLDLRADLVVLSGCSTGLGKLSGDGILGLARAFLYAGTPSVIVSQWDVSDKATAFLMDRLYAERQTGKGKAHALRLAQLAARARFGHPALWAAFSLVGEP